jgi:sugar-specific transcriptional regulator TrmB
LPILNSKQLPENFKLNLNENLETIQKLGLSQYEAKCYLALFERESLTVIEITSLTGIPRPNAYEAMKKLLAKGLCISIPGKTQRYAACDPGLLHDKADAIIDSPLDDEIIDLENKKKLILQKKKDIRENLDNVVNGLKTVYENSRNKNHPLESIEILKEPALVHSRLLELSSLVKYEMVGFVKPPFSYNIRQDKNVLTLKREQGKNNSNVLKKGVKERCIWDFESIEQEIVPYYKQLRYRYVPGVVRICSKVPFKMVVFDRTYAMFSLEDPIGAVPSTTSILLRHQALAEILVATFESYWEKATPAEEYLANNDIIKNSKYKTSSTERKTT